MKRVMIEQTGSVQVDVCRKFLVEVPDDCDKEQALRLMQEMESDTHHEDAEWADDDGTRWVGYDVEFVDTAVRDLGPVDGVVDLKAIRLGIES
jgi:hypothetical protein